MPLLSFLLFKKNNNNNKQTNSMIDYLLLQPSPGCERYKVPSTLFPFLVEINHVFVPRIYIRTKSTRTTNKTNTSNETFETRLNLPTGSKQTR